MNLLVSLYMLAISFSKLLTILILLLGMFSLREGHRNTEIYYIEANARLGFRFSGFSIHDVDLIVGISVFVSFKCKLNANGIGKGKNNPNQSFEILGDSAARGTREGFLRFVSRGLFSGRRLDGTLTEVLDAFAVTSIPSTRLGVFSVIIFGKACTPALYCYGALGTIQ